MPKGAKETSGPDVVGVVRDQIARGGGANPRSRLRIYNIPMRLCLCWLVAAVACLAGDPQATVALHGKRIVRTGQPTPIETDDHQTVRLDGPPESNKALSDPRIHGFAMQAKRHFTAPDRFRPDPIHPPSRMGNPNGPRQMVTYGCDGRSIRAGTPGPYVGCQKETVLERRDPSEF